MPSHFRWLAAALLVLAFATDACADVVPCMGGWIRRDRPDFRMQHVPLDEYDFEIIRDANVQEAELRIPRRMLAAQTPAADSTRTAMTGLALSVAFVAGGLWCVSFRGSKIPKKKLIGAGGLAALLVASLAFVSFASADVPALPATNIDTHRIQLGDVQVQVHCRCGRLDSTDCTARAGRQDCGSLKPIEVNMLNRSCFVALIS